jgi:formylglycine-generating enzyme required for sulfatase activity
MGEPSAVMQAQWQAVMGTNPSAFKGDKLQVEHVSWEDAQQFIQKLNEKEGKEIYRLPTEAEWEYACRAGSSTIYCFGDDEGQLGEYAWYTLNSGKRTHPVGTRKPNAWGLYDMHGNVWEWVQDGYGNYTADPVTDPIVPAVGTGRVIRGGNWNSVPRTVRAGYRVWNEPDYHSVDIGFRCMRSASH